MKLSLYIFLSPSSHQLCRSLSPSLALSLQLEGEQREWKKKVREGREREARQALLIHRLQNKVRPKSLAVLIIGVDVVGDGKY